MLSNYLKQYFKEKKITQEKIKEISKKRRRE